MKAKRSLLCGPELQRVGCTGGQGEGGVALAVLFGECILYPSRRPGMLTSAVKSCLTKLTRASSVLRRISVKYCALCYRLNQVILWSLYLYRVMFAQKKQLSPPARQASAVVLQHSADEGSEKRVLRCARFSEIMRTLLIGWEHLTFRHAHKYGCFWQAARVVCNVSVMYMCDTLPFCVLVETLCSVHAHISRSALSLWYCVS